MTIEFRKQEKYVMGKNRNPCKQNRSLSNWFYDAGRAFNERMGAAAIGGGITTVF